MPAKDWSKIYEQYKGLWVALKDDEETVIASAPTLKEVARKAAEKGHPDPIFAQIPETLMAFVG
jgi:hypothetical protein